MNKHIPIAIVAALGICLVSLLYAANAENSALAASLTVNAFVDTSISTGALSFGSLDPATSANPATQNPVVLNNTVNSNTAIDIFLNNTNMTNASNFIPSVNLSVNIENTSGTAKRFYANNTYINSSVADGGFYENLATNSGINLYFWHDVPAGQTAGVYTANVTIRSVQDAVAP